MDLITLIAAITFVLLVIVIVAQTIEIKRLSISMENTVDDKEVDKEGESLSPSPTYAIDVDVDNPIGRRVQGVAKLDNRDDMILFYDINGDLVYAVMKRRLTDLRARKEGPYE